MKKTAAAILALIILLSALACAPAATPTPTTEPTPTATPAPTAEVTPTPSSTVSINKELFASDKEMLRVDGEPVYWDEAFYWIMQNIMNLTGGGILDDWTVAYNDSLTVEQFIKDKAVEYAAFYRNMSAKAKEAGIELTQEEKDKAESTIQSYITYLGSAEALDEYMEKSYLTTEIYRSLLEFSALNDRLFTHMFGEGGKNCSDEDTLAFGEECSIVNVKHILLSTKEKTDEEKAAILKTITGYLDEINAAEDKAAKFDELMNAHSEDTGLETNPNGYQFEPNTMVQVFEDAADALKPGEISAVVESTHGYHIIMRLPIDPDGGIVGDSYGYTLRYYAAYNQYSSLADSWYAESEVTLSDDFKSFSLNDLFVFTPGE